MISSTLRCWACAEALSHTEKKTENENCGFMDCAIQLRKGRHVPGTLKISDDSDEQYSCAPWTHDPHATKPRRLMFPSMLYHPVTDGGSFPDRWSSNKPAHVRRGYQVSRIMPACDMMPADKKAFVGAVGEDLVKRHGKKRYHRLDEIARSATDRVYPIDVHCWAYCIFSSADDFRSFHDALGELAATRR